MRCRWILTAAVMSLCALTFVSPVRAQVSSIAPTPGAPPGWSFNVTPYIWLPTISANIQANTPRGGTVSTTVSAGFGKYLQDINFGALAGAAARYDRFSALTDIVYLNTSLTSTTSHISTLNIGPGPIDIPRSQQLFTGTRMATTIWSLAGTYTVLAGDWGNIDVVGGFRLMSVSSTTNYLLAADIYAPDRTIALSHNGSLDVGKTYVDGVGGITGRINIPNSQFYLPFYFDAGGGGVPFTWQAYAAVAYKAATWADVSLGYRYLDFQGSNSVGIRKLSLGGAILAANFKF